MANFFKIFSAEGFQNISSSFQIVHKRFPLTLIASLLGTVLFILIIENERDFTERKILLTAALAVPLMFSIEIFNERKYFNKYYSIFFGFCFLLLFFTFYQFENEYKEGRKSAIIFVVLAIIFHLLVSVAPYLGKKLLKDESEISINQFWQYNKVLFLNILNAFLYSFTLAGGLCLAILAIDKLFDVKIDDEWYRNIFIFINGYCNTIFFLAKLPSLAVIDSKTDDYPIGLKYFTQYVLLPLVVIYVLILLAYEFKIIAQWQLPKGWVSVLVMASAIFGILAFLLLYPLRSTNKWVANFTKLYYWVLIPLIGLMIVAIYVRISEYGVTEPRYFIALISIWLLGISIYFGFSKVDNIKIIPMSLIIIGLIAIFGPFNAFFASRYNQENRLIKVLKKNDLLKNGMIAKPLKLNLTDQDSQILSSSIDYLTENNLASIQKYLVKSDFDSLEIVDIYSRENKMYELIGFEKKLKENLKNIRNINRIANEVEKLNGADYAAFIDDYSDKILEVEGSKIVITKDSFSPNGLCVIEIDGQKVTFDFTFLMTKVGQNLNAEQLTAKAETSKWKCSLVLDSVNFQEDDEDVKVQNFSGKLYLTKKTK